MGELNSDLGNVHTAVQTLTGALSSVYKMVVQQVVLSRLPLPHTKEHIGSPLIAFSVRCWLFL
jgi:hypothetical protein